jgi:hypothetical protein
LAGKNIAQNPVDMVAFSGLRQASERVLGKTRPLVKVKNQQNKKRPEGRFLL